MPLLMLVLLAAPPAECRDAAMTTDGDAGRGQALFRDRTRGQCVVCHRVGNEGGQVGPDLSHIGGKFDRPHLIESLLEPSAQIVEGYGTTLLALEDGRTLTGVVRDEDGRTLTLHDAAGKAQEIAVADVAARQAGAKSLMAEDLYATWSTEEFVDLVAYLETLRPGGKPEFGAGVTGAIRIPDGFAMTTVATGLTGLTALECAPDGRVFLCEQTGTVRVVKDGGLLAEPFATLPVDGRGERGVIGVTVHPDFPQTPYVYVCWVAAEPYPHHRVSRFVAAGDVAEPGSEVVIFRGDDQTPVQGTYTLGHQGGALHFGPDGMLYLSIGEHTAKTPAQDMGSLLGKILRIAPDGSIPTDNPFFAGATGKYRAIWALGCRNPYTFAIRGDGMFLVNDVGGTTEEINPAHAGANFGWPTADHGHGAEAGFAPALHVYPQSSICGGDFCPPDWPAPYAGRYFFADFVHGWIHTLDADAATADGKPAAVSVFAERMRRPIDLRFAPDGALYVLLRNAWLLDDKFQPHTGSLLRIAPR